MSLKDTLQHLATPLDHPERQNGVPTPLLLHSLGMQTQEVTWLWPGYIPLGMMTLVEGDAGVNKSTMLCDLAAKITRGTLLPAWSGLPAAANVLIVNREDHREKTILPRLDAANADRNRVYFFDGFMEGGKQKALRFDRELHSQALINAVRQYSIKLLIVDPISSYMGKIDTHVEAEIRDALDPLIDVLHDQEAALVVIRHLSKDTSQRSMYRGSGSQAFFNMARAVYKVLRDPEDQDRIIFACDKLNVAQKPLALAFERQGERLIWEEEPFYIDLDRAMGQRPESQTALQEAVEFLRDELVVGTGTPSQEVIRHGKENGISEITLLRAKKMIPGLKTYKRKGDGKWCLIIDTNISITPSVDRVDRDDRDAPPKPPHLDQGDHLDQPRGDRDVPKDDPEEEPPWMAS